MKKVLIVEDEDNIRQLIKACIGPQTYEIAEAADGESAVESAVSFSPDLVILDIMLPDMWGYEVCEKIINDLAGREPKILMLTARASIPSQKISEMKGAQAYMTKPFKPDELTAKVKELLGEQ